MSKFHDFLLQSYPNFTPQTGHPVLPEVAPQSHYYRQCISVLRQQTAFFLQGPDIIPFLQGQLCGDVRQLNDAKSLWTAHCTPQGRVFSTLLLAKHGERIWAICPASHADALFERLLKYKLFSKLDIETPTQPPTLLECTGPDTAAALSDWCPQLPQQPMQTWHSEKLQIIRQHGEQPRWLLILHDTDLAITLWNQLAKTHALVSEHDRQRLLVEAGLVDIGKELQEAFLPQMIGLDQLGGMSLKKGCYVGQEVIARTSHQGKLKRKLYRALLAGEHDLTIGTDIVNAAGTVLGTCVNGYADKTTVLLAVIAERGLNEVLYCHGVALTDITAI